jgi:hypothetical protein
VEDHCSAAAALSVEDGSDDSDYRVTLDTSSAFAVFSVSEQDVDGEHADVGLNAGRIAFHTDDAACVASPDHPCSIDLHQFVLEFGAMTVPTSSGRADVRSLSVSAEVPSSFVDTGFGYLLDSQVQMRLMASIQDHRDAQVLPLGGSVSMNIDIPNHALSVELSMPFSLRVSQAGSCVTANAQCDLTASAEAPWTDPSH